MRTVIDRLRAAGHRLRGACQRHGALAVALVALVFALDIPSQASHLITGRTVKNGSLTGRDVKDRSLTGRDLKRGTLGGAQIEESRLATVPNAARLAGEPGPNYKDRCPEGLVPVAGTCFETVARPPAPYSIAHTNCASAGTPEGPGRRLPTHGELKDALGDFGITLAEGGELTNFVWKPSTASRGLDVLYVIDSTGNVEITSDTADGAKAYRCVTDPTE